jgi:hypothetical protein
LLEVSVVSQVVGGLFGTAEDGCGITQQQPVLTQPHDTWDTMLAPGVARSPENAAPELTPSVQAAPKNTRRKPAVQPANRCPSRWDTQPQTAHSRTISIAPLSPVSSADLDRIGMQRQTARDRRAGYSAGSGLGSGALGRHKKNPAFDQPRSDLAKLTSEV